MVTNGSGLPIDLEKETATVLERFTRRGNNGQNENYVVLRRTAAGYLQIKFEDRGYIMELNANRAHIEQVKILPDDSAVILLDSASRNSKCGNIRTIILATKDDIQVMDDSSCAKMEYGEVRSKPGAFVYRAVYPQKGIPVFVVENGRLYSTVDDRAVADRTYASGANSGGSSNSTHASRSPRTPESPSQAQPQMAAFVIPKKVPEAEVQATKIQVAIR